MAIVLPHHPWLEADCRKGLGDDSDADADEHHDDDNGDVNDHDVECYNSHGHCRVSGGR